MIDADKPGASQRDQGKETFKKRALLKPLASHSDRMIPKAVSSEKRQRLLTTGEIHVTEIAQSGHRTNEAASKTTKTPREGWNPEVLQHSITNVKFSTKKLKNMQINRKPVTHTEKTKRTKQKLPWRGTTCQRP